LSEFEFWLREHNITNIYVGTEVWEKIKKCQVVFPVEGVAIIDRFFFSTDKDLLPNEILTKNGRFLIFKTKAEVAKYKEVFREIW
jgi:hypothetical protein